MTLVSLGTNDLAAKPAEYKRALIETIVMRVRAAGSAPAWLLPPRVRVADRGGVRAILSAELGRLTVPALDAQALEIPLGADGIHPTPAGFDTWAARIVDWMSVPAQPSPAWPSSPTRPGATSPSRPSSPSAGPTSTSSNGSGIEPIAALGALAFLFRS